MILAFLVFYVWRAVRESLHQKEKVQKAHKRQQCSRYCRIDNISVLTMGSAKAHKRQQYVVYHQKQTDEGAASERQRGELAQEQGK